MIDTHAHLTTRINPHEGPVDLEAVILSASTTEDSVENIELAKTQKNLFPAVGVHPMEAGQEVDDQINFLDDLLNKFPEIVAVGECGLEFVEPYDAKKQEILFRGQIALALKYKKTLIVHSREAAEDTLRILSEYKDLSGVIHCYTGGKKRIRKYLDLPGEWFFGIDGNLTYEPGLQEVVKQIPKDRIILETDTPFLTPIPHRGETNKPEYVEYIYRKVAEIWGTSFEETERVIDQNARRLFSI